MGKSKKREYKIKQINQSNNDESVKKCASKTRKTIKNKTRTKYTKEAVERALKAVSAGISVRKTSDTFGVPATTIFRKYKSPELLTCKMGSPTILTAAEEEDIVKWLIYKAQIGCPVTKTELLDNVQFYLKLMKKKTPFTNDRPGRHWYEAFCKRNPDIRIRTAQNLTLVRASISEDELRNWFSEIKTYLESKNLLDVEPSSIFNCDETNIQLCPKPEKVIARKGARSVYKVVDALEKESVTALFMYSASGVRAPPMLIYMYKENIPKKIIENFPRGWGIGISESGWMTTETFYEYFTNVFYKWLISENILFPVLVYMDGHSSHCSLPLVKFCRERSIELISLYPHATHILQPLDVGLFHPLKELWKKIVPKWKLENNIMRLRKEQFPAVLQLTLDSLENECDIIKNAFKACGLAPFNPEAVEYNVLYKKKKTKLYEENLQVQENFQQQEIQQSQGNERSEQHQNYPMEQYLKTFENTIDLQLFQEFQNAEASGLWTGNIEKKGLFEYWLGIKHKNHDEIKAHVNENNSSRPVIKMIQNLDNQYILNNGRILLPLTEQNNLKCLEENLMDNARSQNVIDNKTEFENSNVNENSAVESTNALMPISPDQLFELPISLVHPAQENIQDIENNNIIMIEDLSNLSTDIGEISLTSYNSYVPNILKPRNSLNNQNSSCKAKTFEITAAIPETQESEIESLKSTCEGNISFVADKENDKTFANKNAQVTDPESFSKAFTLPEQYLTKKKRDIIMKCNKPKLPSAGTSDDWLKIQEQKEKEKRLKEEQKEKKKQLQEEKKKIAEEKKKLVAKIKEIQKKIKTEKL